MRHTRKTHSSGGFSLVEVMRALVSLEAASLASAIRANRTYWAASATAVGADLIVKTTGATIASSTDGTLTTAEDCSFGGANAPCATGPLAAYDVQQWAKQINTLIPGVISTIDCTLPALSTPVTCTIQINWTENEVAASSQATGAMAVPQYTLYVEP
jgi:hypothetical protein